MADVVGTRVNGGAQLRVARAKWTPTKRNEFLAELAQSCNVSRAARAVGMSDKAGYRLRTRDPAFREAWNVALSEGYAKLEMLLVQRGLAGLEGDEVAPGKSMNRPGLSERTLMSLIANHRQSVRDYREAAAKARSGDAAREDAEVRARLIEKLEEMRARVRGL